ncbi:hypothetical protein DM860_009088 [Cuscuta australis]|uniref:Uncharacterized protein n=1 Tax=Cuscuta australis TaxID=267555 RepID=A0A328D8W0_9ASTE|nr:hypothetical protein DM860_009088 [Cuscuta australis]
MGRSLQSRPNSGIAKGAAQMSGAVAAMRKHGPKKTLESIWSDQMLSTVFSGPCFLIAITAPLI